MFYFALILYFQVEILEAFTGFETENKYKVSEKNYVQKENWTK